ncbi:hypothetical protein BGZ65_011981, partial [Modicella reniformis]
MATYNLFCLFEGQSTSDAFSVDIDSDKLVCHLKKTINAEMTPKFDNIDVNELTLWRVSIPFTIEEKSITMKDIENKDKTKLLPIISLKTLFKNDPEEGNVHILVQTPPS